MTFYPTKKNKGIHTKQKMLFNSLAQYIFFFCFFFIIRNRIFTYYIYIHTQLATGLFPKTIYIYIKKNTLL